MEVKTIFVTTLLTIQKELAKFRSPKGSSDHPVVQNKLIYRKNSNGAFSWVSESDVCRVRGPSSGSIVNIVSVYYYFLEVTILAEILWFS